MGEMDPVTVYQCSVCSSYFEDYVVATTHLALSHPNALKVALSSSSSLQYVDNLKKQRQLIQLAMQTIKGMIAPSCFFKNRRQKGQNQEQEAVKSDRGGLSLIESCVFPHPRISLERIDPIKSKTGIQIQEGDSKTTISVNSINNSIASTSFSSQGKIEIKLDTLKASEMEALIKDLFQNQKQQPNCAVSVKRTATCANVDHKDKRQKTFGSRVRNPKPDVAEAAQSSKIPRKCPIQLIENNNTASAAEKISSRLKLNPNPKTFPCSACPMKFVTSKRRAEHERRVHMTEFKYNCPKCPRTYASSKSLRKHTLKNHPPTGHR